MLLGRSRKLHPNFSPVTGGKYVDWHVRFTRPYPCDTSSPSTHPQDVTFVQVGTHTQSVCVCSSVCSSVCSFNLCCACQIEAGNGQMRLVCQQHATKRRGLCQVVLQLSLTELELPRVVLLLLLTLGQTGSHLLQLSAAAAAVRPLQPALFTLFKQLVVFTLIIQFGMLALRNCFNVSYVQFFLKGNALGVVVVVVGHVDVVVVEL